MPPAPPSKLRWGQSCRWSLSVVMVFATVRASGRWSLAPFRAFAAGGGLLPMVAIPHQPHRQTHYLCALSSLPRSHLQDYPHLRFVIALSRYCGATAPHPAKERGNSRSLAYARSLAGVNSPRTPAWGAACPPPHLPLVLRLARRCACGGVCAWRCSPFRLCFALLRPHPRRISL